jgi:hypothetical protein
LQLHQTCLNYLVLLLLDRCPPTEFAQGDVESIASRTPAELTKLFENISGSDELIAEYEELKRAKQTAEEELKFAQQKKKGFTAEKRQYKEQVDEVGGCPLTFCFVPFGPFVLPFNALSPLSLRTNDTPQALP